ncbi:MAG: efflux RND transporter periplasmic adaptor subunit, partial [Caulobacteraceae bacterium]
DTPASRLAFRQAADAVAYAEKDLGRVQRLFAQQLAATDQLAAAQKTLADARGALAAQTASGGGAQQVLKSPMAGVVSQVAATVGERMAADAPILTLVASGGLIAQLGVEPDRARGLAPGDAVTLRSALDPHGAFASKVAIVGRQVDATSRLVPVAVPAEGAGLALGTAVEGRITTSSHPGLTVPRGAVVYDENGAHVFVLRGGKARQVPVRTGAEEGDAIEVAGALRAGDPVAVAGAYQLQDGLAVRITGR